MALARQALVSAGYKVIDMKIPSEFYEEGRNLTIEMVANLNLVYVFENFRKSGEVLDFTNWQTWLLVEA